MLAEKDVIFSNYICPRLKKEVLDCFTEVVIEGKNVSIYTGLYLHEYIKSGGTKEELRGELLRSMNTILNRKLKC